MRIERITFRLDRSTYSCIRPCRVTLRDEAACSCCLRGDNEIVGPLCSQTVSQLELPIELADVEALGDSGELVHDHIRVRLRSAASTAFASRTSSTSASAPINRSPCD